MMRRFLAAGLLAVAAVVSPRLAHAQAVLGIGDDALTLPNGVVRFRLGGSWSAFNERYGAGTPGRPDGALEPLGINYNLDTLGAAQFRSLTPVQSSIRALTGQSDFVVSLGKTVTSINDQITVLPIVIEDGFSRRLMLGVTVPLVETHVNVFFQANPANREGNVGFNPAIPNTSIKVADSAFAAQMVALATQVQNYCTTNPSVTQCANGTAATAAAAVTFGNGLGQLYTTAQFVPVSGSATQQTIDARAASYKATLNALATLVGGTAITGAGVTGAAALNTNDMQTILMDPTYGVAAEPMERINKYRLGDIELNAKLLLHDPFRSDSVRMQPQGVHTRFAVGAMLRLPTGKAADPNDFVDIGSGTQEWAVGARGYGDLLIGQHFWTSLVARYDMQMGDDRTMRITATPDQIFAPQYTEATVHRKLGNLFELEATPRWAFNDFFVLSAQYLYRHKPADEYTGTSFSVTNEFTGGETVTMNPATLGLETGLTEHRFGGGIAFSNLHAVSLGKAHLPFEVSYQHMQTTSGSGGNVPKQTIDQIQIRIYTRIFGR